MPRRASRRATKKKAPVRVQALGIAEKNRKILLFYREERDRRGSVRVAVSKDGVLFQPAAQGAVFLGPKGKSERMANCHDFRFAKSTNGYVFFYLYTQGGKHSLRRALSRDAARWQADNYITEVREPTVPVAGTGKNHYVAYAGGKGILFGSSPDGRRWAFDKKPIVTPRKGFFDNGTLIPAASWFSPEGTVLVYYARGGRGKDARWSLGAARFDVNEPKHVLWRSDTALWEEPPEWRGKKLLPVGAIPTDGLLRLYWQDQGSGEILSAHCLFPDAARLLAGPPIVPLLARFEGNPVLTPLPHQDWESHAVFNAAALHEKGKVHLLYRAVGNDGMSRVGYARMNGGFVLEERWPHPVYVHGNTPSYHPMSHVSGGGWGGVEDPRLVRIEDTIYMTYLCFDGDPRIALTSIESENFFNKRWDWSSPVMISPPRQLHKNWVLFPAKIGGKYAILHSISPQILIDYFDTLDFDGATHIKSFYGWDEVPGGWELQVRGVGPPPLATDRGWLVLYHAIDRHDPGKYKLGAMLLDKDDPSKVLCRSPRPVFGPQMHYENDGHKAGVIYTCGAVVMDGRLVVYYGGADTVVCAADADLEEFLSQIASGLTPQMKPVMLRIS